MAQSRDQIIEMLKTAYSMELETVMNYLANSTNLDGIRAEEIKKSLAACFATAAAGPDPAPAVQA